MDKAVTMQDVGYAKKAYVDPYVNAIRKEINKQIAGLIAKIKLCRQIHNFRLLLCGNYNSCIA